MAPSSGGHATFAYFMKDLTKKLLQLKNESQGRLPAQLCTGSWGPSVWGDQGLVARSMGEEWAKTTFEDHIAYLRRREDERAILAFFAWKRKVLHVAFDSCVGGTHSWHVELTFGILGLEDVISKRAARACRPFSELQGTSALNADLLAVGGGQLCKSSLSLKDLLIQNGLPRDVPLQEEVGNETVALGQFLPGGPDSG